MYPYSTSGRCRRKRRFIVTFWHSRLCDPVCRHSRRLSLRVHFQKVPTKVAYHRHLLAFAAVLLHLQALQTAKSPRPLPEGADESGVSSSPSGIRGCVTPSLGTSACHASSFLSRRCRRKRRFIVTFWHSQLSYPVLRHFSLPCFLVSFQKVPTKVAFHRHLLAFAAVRPRS